jgi:membrane-associated protease RseP (regulator of RpoE activity)
VQVRLQRGNVTKEVPVRVEKRPTDYGSDCANMEQLIGPEHEAPVIMLGRPWPRGAVIAKRMPPAGWPPDGSAPAVAGGTFAGGNYAYSFNGMNSTIAGATVMVLDDDWRQSLGVDNGVLVMKVAPGTPAKDAGLRSSDVIVAADGEPISSLGALRRIMNNAKSNSLKLQIIRAQKTQTVMLRWQEREP